MLPCARSPSKQGKRTQSLHRSRLRELMVLSF
ncbi:hypothetical protein NC651_030159 [Populus alba x Populus x berolinensis]|nr:hypothetical protein NC651_030159 [Populus alba x Populus x berolinensis]